MLSAISKQNLFTTLLVLSLIHLVVVQNALALFALLVFALVLVFQIYIDHKEIKSSASLEARLEKMEEKINQVVTTQVLRR